MNALARDLVAPYRGSPYRIGYFSDNEVGWWAGALFVFYSIKTGELGDQAALGRDAAPALWRRLVALRRRFLAAGGGRVHGRRSSPPRR